MVVRIIAVTREVYWFSLHLHRQVRIIVRVPSSLNTVNYTAVKKKIVVPVTFLTIIYEPRCEKTGLRGFRLPQKMARGLKFWIYIEVELHYPCGENKAADQLRGYREADQRLCFGICKKPVFSRRGSYTNFIRSYFFFWK